MGKLNHNHLNILIEQGRQLEKAHERLTFSYEKAKLIDLTKKEFTHEEFEVLEALCSRFSRVSDIMIQKIFRLIDLIELEEANTSIIDRIEKAEKRELIDSADTFKQIRELRNEVAHEYNDEKYAQIFHDVMSYIPSINESFNRITKYIASIKSQN